MGTFITMDTFINPLSQKNIIAVMSNCMQIVCVDKTAGKRQTTQKTDAKMKRSRLFCPKMLCILDRCMISLESLAVSHVPSLMLLAVFILGMRLPTSPEVSLEV